VTGLKLHRDRGPTDHVTNASMLTENGNFNREHAGNAIMLRLHEFWRPYRSIVWLSLQLLVCIRSRYHVWRL
jgi:hypothetical protein